MIKTARVISLDRGYPLVKTDDEEVRAQHSIDLVKNSDLRSVVGDIVDVEFPQGQETPLIVAIHPRGHCLVRRTLVESRSVGSGKHDEQILAANIDTVFVISALGNQHVDLNYLERQLVMAHDSGAELVVVLSKADLAKHLDADLEAVQTCAPGLEVIVESATSGAGISRIKEIVAGKNVSVLLGRSGVGKSSLINVLVDKPLQHTKAVRSKDRAGRHATVGRKMIFLDERSAKPANGASKGGSAIIDTPGLRSIGLYDAHFGLAKTFTEITKLSEECRYRDCSHTGEPNCAVRAALSSGKLQERRLSNYIDIACEVKD